MRTSEAVCTCTTSGQRDIVDITEDVQRAVLSSGIADGHVTITAPDDSCSIVVNERESGLLADIRRALDRAAAEGSSRIGSRSVVLPAAQGRLRLGTWQRVLLIELGSGAERSITVRVEGE